MISSVVSRNSSDKQVIDDFSCSERSMLNSSYQSLNFKKILNRSSSQIIDDMSNGEATSVIVTRISNEDSMSANSQTVVQNQNNNV